MDIGRNLTKLLLSLVVLVIFQMSCSTKADYVIINADIWTAASDLPRAEAMAIKDDLILAIESNEEVLNLSSGSNVIDANNQFISPGFIDSHVHLLTVGRSLLSVELRDADTPEEFTNRIGTYAQTLEEGEWILEGNWDHTLWGGALPTKEWIDEVTSNHPMGIFRLDGHMVLANSKALTLAGIDDKTQDIPGGEIVRDNNGLPTGILKNNAMHIVLDKIPLMSMT